MQKSRGLAQAEGESGTYLTGSSARLPRILGSHGAAESGLLRRCDAGDGLFLLSMRNRKEGMLLVEEGRAHRRSVALVARPDSYPAESVAPWPDSSMVIIRAELLPGVFRKSTLMPI